MTRAHRTVLTFDYPNRDSACLVTQSVAQEVDEIDGDRAVTTIDREGTSVTIEIHGDDLVALRAAGNTWLSLVQVAERVTTIADGRDSNIAGPGYGGF